MLNFIFPSFVFSFLIMTEVIGKHGDLIKTWSNKIKKIKLRKINDRIETESKDDTNGQSGRMKNEMVKNKRQSEKGEEFQRIWKSNGQRNDIEWLRLKKWNGGQWVEEWNGRAGLMKKRVKWTKW